MECVLQERLPPCCPTLAAIDRNNTDLVALMDPFMNNNPFAQQCGSRGVILERSLETMTEKSCDDKEEPMRPGNKDLGLTSKPINIYEKFIINLVA